MVVAHDLAERRKGSALLGEVLRQIRRRPLTVVTLGNGHISVSTQEISVCELGYVDHERTKALAYMPPTCCCILRSWIISLT